MATLAGYPVNANVGGTVAGHGISDIYGPSNPLTPNSPDLTSNFNDVNAQGGGSGYIAPPKLDTAALFANARSAAEGAQNPLYTKYLNDFLTQQSAQKQQQQTSYDTSIQNLRDTLKNTLQGNEISGQRNLEDANNKIGDINTQSDQYQTDSGTAFDTARRQDAVKQASQGLLGSGLGNQSTTLAQGDRNTQEARQGADFQRQKDQTALAEGRTFEDLARSGTLATQGEAKGEKAAKFDLDNFIQNQGFDLSNKRNDLEVQRLGAIQGDAQNRAKIALNDYISRITNPEQKLAAVQLYGGLI